MTEIKLKPLGDRILVLPDALEETSKIIDTAEEKPTTGVAVRVGRGTTEVSMEVEANNKVLFNKLAGQDVEWEGVKYRLMRQDEILSVIED